MRSGKVELGSIRKRAPFSRHEVTAHIRDKPGPGPRAERCTHLPICSSYRESRLSQRSSPDGPDPVHLVPPIRSKPAEVRSQYFSGSARRLSKGYPAHLPPSQPCRQYQPSRGSALSEKGRTGRAFTFRVDRLVAFALNIRCIRVVPPNDRTGRCWSHHLPYQ